MHDLKRLATDANEVIISPHLLEAESMRLAEFVHAIADPTPLTEEVLLEKAKVVTTLYGQWAAYFTGVHVILFPGKWQWRTSDLQPLPVTPRTLGELTMLELMMENR